MSTKGDKMNAIEQACVDIAKKLEAAYDIYFTWGPVPNKNAWQIHASWKDTEVNSGVPITKVHSSVASITAQEIYNLTDAKQLIKHRMFDLVDQLKPPMKEQKVNVAEGDGWFSTKNYSVDIPISKEEIEKPPTDAGAITYEMVEKAYKTAMNPYSATWSMDEAVFSSSTTGLGWITPDNVTQTVGNLKFSSNITCKTPTVQKTLYGITDGPTAAKSAAPPKVYTMDELYADELSGKAVERPKSGKGKKGPTIEEIGNALGDAMKKHMNSDEMFKADPLLKYLIDLGEQK